MSFTEKLKGLFTKKKKPEKIVTGNAKIDTETSLWERIKAKYFNMFFVKKLGWVIFRLVLLIGISYVIIYPYFSKITTSLMAREDFVDTTVLMIPRNWTLDTYKAIINDNKYFTALFNTTTLSLLCGVSQTLICAIVGYGFAKFKFKFKGALFLLVIFTMVVPHETIRQAMILRFRYLDLIGIIPQLNGWIFNMFDGGTISPETYEKFTDFIGLIPNALNTYWPMAILSLTGLAFKNGLYIFMMRQFYRGVPDELEESAYIDGSGTFRTFWQIIVPLSVPMMITVFLFAFCWQWTDTFYSGLFYTQTGPTLLNKIIKVPDSLAELSESSSALFGSAVKNTCGILIIIPLVVMYLFGQKYIVQGIERSGITG